ncbi:alpha-xenorhabdolysin family binary toxin subunit B [Pseudomonas sp. RC10]|uniref:alpha-xenorhabdolysin family binary toxin subunit B n=1 Tax=Pseudomonas bambusae TaxID=3139142 RepID=UPI003138E4F1
MSTIARFPTRADYPELDIHALQQAKTQASNATIEVKRLFIQTQYLPSLHGRICDLDRSLRNAHSKLRDIAQSMDILLGINVGTLRELHEEFQSAPESDKEEIIEDIVHRVETILGVVGKKEMTLSNLMTALASPIDRATTQSYVKQLEDDQARLPSEVLEIKERQTALEEKRKALTDAMAVIEAKGFSALAKDTALTAQELVKLGMTPPQLIAVEGAIELVQQILEKAEGLINYLGMVEARNALRKQIDALIASTQEKAHELRLVTSKKELIVACHDFDDHRAQYIAEFEKIVAAKRSFLSTHSAVNAENQDTIAQLIVDALALAKHLKVIP